MRHRKTHWMARSPKLQIREFIKQAEVELSPALIAELHDLSEFMPDNWDKEAGDNYGHMRRWTRISPAGNVNTVYESYPWRASKIREVHSHHRDRWELSKKNDKNEYVKVSYVHSLKGAKLWVLSQETKG